MAHRISIYNNQNEEYLRIISSEEPRIGEDLSIKHTKNPLSIRGNDQITVLIDSTLTWEEYGRHFDDLDLEEQD